MQQVLSNRNLIAVGFAVIVLSVLSGVALWIWQARLPGYGSDYDKPLEGLKDFGAVPDFTFTERDGREIALSDLKGKVWIVNFIYTNCPDTCPLGVACVLHLLLIEFPGQAEALTFFDRVTQIGMEGETVIPAPNADVWDASKCATGTRPSSAGAPDFAVLYCSITEGLLHWGFNLSAYEDLPESLVDQDLDDLMNLVHEYLSVWQ